VIALPDSGAWRGAGDRPELIEMFDEKRDHAEILLDVVGSTRRLT
jgi:hypothetical protein